MPDDPMPEDDAPPAPGGQALTQGADRPTSADAQAESPDGRPPQAGRTMGEMGEPSPMPGPAPVPPPTPGPLPGPLPEPDPLPEPGPGQPIPQARLDPGEG